MRLAWVVVLFVVAAGSVVGQDSGLNGGAADIVIGRTGEGSPIKVWRVGKGGGREFFVNRSPGRLGAEGFGISVLPPGPYPPRGEAYNGPNAASHYLWRWLLLSGCEKVHAGDESSELREAFEKSRLDLQARGARTPEEMIAAVAPHYAQKFDSNSYVEALALMAGGGRERTEEVMEPWLSGEKKLKPVTNAGTLAGRLVFTSLDDERALQVVKDSVAIGFDKQGNPLPAMPTHNEMSDAVFMACPLLAKAGRLTGEERYFKLCVEHLQFMQGKCLREDGIYRHSPLNEGAWGRGNGFPALGLALAIPEFPESHPGRRMIVDSLTEHLQALIQWQSDSGMWHQLIDRPDSYREFTSTCMITFALARADREGWMEVPDDVIDRAWLAIKQRVSLDGKSFFDACTGTGKQKTLEDYYLRKAILGPDQRSAAMLLTVAREMTLR